MCNATTGQHGGTVIEVGGENAKEHKPVPVGLPYSTTSFCPACRRRIPARVEACGDSVHMLRTCPEHGDSKVRITGDPDRFQERLRRYFRPVTCPRDPARPGSLTLHLTDRCDLDCPICFTGLDRPALQDASLDSIEEALQTTETHRIALFGGEPLVRTDLDEIVGLVRRYGKEPILYTNGVRLADSARAACLATAGLGEVHLQFDGFDQAVSRSLRGLDLLETRFAAVEACEKAGISLVLEVTCSPSSVPADLARTLDYALGRPSIGGVVFRGLGRAGSAGNLETGLSEHDVLTLVVEATEGRISKDGVDRFEAITLAVQDLMGWPRATCFRNRFYPVMKTKGPGGYTTVEEILPLEDILAALDGARPSLPGMIGPALASMKALTRKDALRLSFEVLRLVLSRKIGAVNTRYPARGRLLLVGIAGLCEPHTFDSVVGGTCTSALFDNNGLHPYASEGHLDRTWRSR